MGDLVGPETIIGIDASYSMTGIAFMSGRSWRPTYATVIKEPTGNKHLPIWERADALASVVYAEIVAFTGKVVIGVEGPAPMAKIRRKGVEMVNTRTIEQLARLRQAVAHVLRVNVDDDGRPLAFGPQILGYYEPTPNQVKKAATGKGNAKKDHVVNSVRAWIRDEDPVLFNEMSRYKNRLEAMTDAFGVALSAAKLHKQKTLEAMT